MELNGLYKTIVDNNVPFSACLEVTTRCNSRCVHCYNVGAHDLPLDVIKRTMDEMASLGTLFLTITGGEPMLRDDIWEMLEYSVKLDFATLLYTNATLIGKEEAAKLRKTGVYHIDTTLLGACPETHDKITGRAGSFEKTMSGIRAVKEAGISLLVKTPVMSGNFDELSGIRNTLDKMGVQHMSSPLIFSRDDGDGTPLKLRLEDEQMKKYFVNNGLRSIVDHNGGYPCHMGICTVAVRADGEVHPCISVPLNAGNVKDAPLREIWERSEKFSYVRGMRDKMVPGCSGCGIKDWCFRCEGISFFESGGLFEPAEELCRMARIRKEASVEGR